MKSHPIALESLLLSLEHNIIASMYCTSRAFEAEADHGR